MNMCDDNLLFACNIIINKREVEKKWQKIILNQKKKKNRTENSYEIIVKNLTS